MMRNKITHEGEIKLGDFSIPCYVLEDGKRVLSGRGMQSALKMVDETLENKKTSGARLDRYLNQKTLEPFIYKDKEVDHFSPIDCYKGNQKINGFEATILVDICDAFLEARKHIPLSTRQQIIADQCEILVRAFARLGLIALIDEATGYQYDREKDELQKLINAYVAEELRPWSHTFKDTYYREIFRLRGWDFTVSGIKKRPGVVGTWTNKLIYEQLPKGVLEELKKKTPKSESGNYTARFHQSLTDDIGASHLDSQYKTVVNLMEAADTWDEFIKFFNKVVERRKGNLQLELQLKLKPEDFSEESYLSPKKDPDILKIDDKDWDEQIKVDFLSGKFNQLIKKAREEFTQGKAIEI